jgi:hypothetical protein
VIQKLLALVAREPAVVVSLIDAVLVVGVTFGLHLAPEQTAAVDALLVVLAGVFTRSQVSPVVVPTTPAVTITAPPAA